MCGFPVCLSVCLSEETSLLFYVVGFGQVGKCISPLFFSPLI